MPTVYFLCGMATAGKTTLAKQIEAEHNAVRFTLDQRMIEKTDLTIHDDEYGRLVGIEKMLIWDEALPILASGRDVVLDWSLWSKSARAEWSTRATDAGYDYLITYLEVPLEELKRRVVIRNRNKGEFVHEVEPEEIERFWHIFEPPTAAEGLNLKMIKG